MTLLSGYSFAFIVMYFNILDRKSNQISFLTFLFQKIQKSLLLCFSFYYFSKNRITVIECIQCGLRSVCSSSKILNLYQELFFTSQILRVVKILLENSILTLEHFSWIYWNADSPPPKPAEPNELCSIWQSSDALIGERLRAFQHSTAPDIGLRCHFGNSMWIEHCWSHATHGVSCHLQKPSTDIESLLQTQTRTFHIQWWKWKHFAEKRLLCLYLSVLSVAFISFCSKVLF